MPCSVLDLPLCLGTCWNTGPHWPGGREGAHLPAKQIFLRWIFAYMWCNFKFEGILFWSDSRHNGRVDSQGVCHKAGSHDSGSVAEFFVFIMFVFISLQEWLSVETCASHITCRGMTRVWCVSNIGNVLWYLTRQGLFNFGILTMPKEIDFMPKELIPQVHICRQCHWVIKKKWWNAYFL